MAHAGPTRREIGVRTAFNLVGPLTNPAGTRRQLLGVADAAAAPRMAEVAQRLGTDRTFVIHGAGIDELPLDGSGVLYDVSPEAIERHGSTPPRSACESRHDPPRGRRRPTRTRGRSRRSCAASPASARDVVLLNAGAALLVAGVVENLEGGIDRAALTIDAGLATELLEALAGSGARAEAPRPRSAADGASTSAGATVAERPRARPTPRRNVVLRSRPVGVPTSRPAPATAGRSPTCRAARRRGRSPSGSPRPGCTSSRRSSGHRRRPAGSPPADEDIVARARAYEAGGAAAISVLCEPHWFGGSIDDLRAVRAAVGVPVLAKEFVVDARSSTMLRAAGADLVLLLAVLHPADAWHGSSRGRCDLGLEPLVEAHDERELRRRARDRMRGSSGSTTATCGRSRSTRARAERSASRVPDDRLVIAESGVRDPATIAPLARARVRRRARRRGAGARGRPRGGGPRVRRRRPAAPRTTRPTSRGGRS